MIQRFCRKTKHKGVLKQEQTNQPRQRALTVANRSVLIHISKPNTYIYIYILLLVIFPWSRQNIVWDRPLISPSISCSHITTILGKDWGGKQLARLNPINVQKFQYSICYILPCFVFSSLNLHREYITHIKNNWKLSVFMRSHRRKIHRSWRKKSLIQTSLYNM